MYPINIVAIAAESAVAINTPCMSIPVSLNIAGFTINIYAIAKKIVIPAMISVFTSVLFSLNLKKASNLDILYIF